MTRPTAERLMALVPVRHPDGRSLVLPTGRRHELVRTIVRDFCPRFTPGGVLAHVRGSNAAMRRLGVNYLERIGLSRNPDSMPDVVVHCPDKNWLVLVDAATGTVPSIATASMSSRVFSSLPESAWCS